GDLEKAILVDRADVARVEPAVLVDRVSRRLGVLQVALEDVVAAHADFAILGDLDLRAGEADAAFSRAVVVGRRERRRPRALAHPVHLEDRDAEGEKELEGVAGDRRRGRHADARAVEPEPRPDLVEDELLGDGVEERPRLTSLLGVARREALLLRP